MNRPKLRALLAEQDRLERFEGRRAEIVDGRLVVLPRTGSMSAKAAFYLTMALTRFQQRTGLGFAIPDRSAYVVKLPHRRCFIPDVSYALGSDDEVFDRDGAPSLAIEVRSEGEYGLRAERALVSKRAEYFEAGTLMVWDVDVLREGFIRSYRKDAPNEPAVCKRGEFAHAEPLLPGLRVDVGAMLDFASRKTLDLPE